jgi:uncharacterized membrane protein YkvA (DUF1232 family)
MTNNDTHNIIPSDQDPGFFRNLSSQLKLVLRLIADSRVNFLLKFLPIATIIYLIVPDFIPGPIDDAVIISLGLFTFVELCPEEVVEEHRSAIKQAESIKEDRSNG